MIHDDTRSHRLVRILLALCLVSIVLGLRVILFPSPVVHANTITVTNTNDSGTGSLRNAISIASPGDTIVFSLTLPATITLSSELAITKSLTISGSGASLLTISGNNATRVITVLNAVTVNLWSVTVANGAGADCGGFNCGGGIYNGGTLNSTTSTFLSSTASGYFGSGGGIYNVGTMNVVNSTFSGNSAYTGGGIYNLGTLTITSTTFSGNSVTSAGGGIANNGTLNVVNSAFSNNSATAQPSAGGGMSNDTGGPLTVVNSTFSGNSAQIGGGIINVGTLIITNSTISGNSRGGIVTSYTAATLQNTIVANNGAGGNCSGTITNGGNNIDDGITCGWGSSNGSMSNTNPLLGPFGNYGGPTKTMALLSGSPAINTGNDAICPPTDQRGFGRVGKCDIGAFEYGWIVRFIYLPLIKR